MLDYIHTNFIYIDGCVPKFHSCQRNWKKKIAVCIQGMIEAKKMEKTESYQFTHSHWTRLVPYRQGINGQVFVNWR